MEINTTLLRERFVIHDTENEEVAPIVAVSNRLALPMYSANGDLTDTFVIRAQNMHGCIRMAAQLLHSFMQHGPILSQNQKFDFTEAWEKSGSRYEITYNKNRWVAVYNKGNEIFSSGSPHAFLGVIEKCDSKNPENYDKSIKIAESAFNKTGRKIAISYEANIGMVLNIKPDIGRCGLIYRGAERNATFNFTAEPNGERTVSPAHCMNICACFLEGLQLSYNIGIIKDKLRLSIIKKFSIEEKEAEQASYRIGDLNRELDIFANRYQLRFRPERPEFSQAIDDAERFHRRMYDRQQKNIQ